MRKSLVLSLSLLAVSPAWAQQPPSPLSGPNTAIASPVCDLINFGFCPQPPGPAAAPFPDAIADAAPPPHPLPPPVHHSRKRNHPNPT